MTVEWDIGKKQKDWKTLTNINEVVRGRKKWRREVGWRDVHIWGLASWFSKQNRANHSQLRTHLHTCLVRGHAAHCSKDLTMSDPCIVLVFLLAMNVCYRLTEMCIYVKQASWRSTHQCLVTVLQNASLFTHTHTHTLWISATKESSTDYANSLAVLQCLSSCSYWSGNSSPAVLNVKAAWGFDKFLTTYPRSLSTKLPFIVLYLSLSETPDTTFVVKGKWYPFSQKCLLRWNLVVIDADCKQFSSWNLTSADSSSSSLSSSLHPW